MCSVMQSIRDEGKLEGRLEGRLEGVREVQTLIISNMLKHGMSIDEIYQLSGASLEEIYEIKKKVDFKMY